MLASYERCAQSRCTPTVIPKPEIGQSRKEKKRVAEETYGSVVRPTIAVK
jgi:hypothetical protein